MPKSEDFESLIDPVEFSAVRRYLEAANSEIHFLLHVNSRSVLAQLASDLDPIIAAGPGKNGENGARLTTLLNAHMNNGQLLFSSRFPLAPPFSNHAISPATIPAATVTYVIYLPPFYLAYTPGLFEGTLVREKVSERTGAIRPKARL
jgi:hypothetical protein